MDLITVVPEVGEDVWMIPTNSNPGGRLFRVPRYSSDTQWFVDEFYSHAYLRDCIVQKNTHIERSQVPDRSSLVFSNVQRLHVEAMDGFSSRWPKVYDSSHGLWH